jgi:hypothetical protein
VSEGCPGYFRDRGHVGPTQSNLMLDVLFGVKESCGGRAAAVDHTFGKGRTRLVDTMCGPGYATHPGDMSPLFLAPLLQFARRGSVCSAETPESGRDYTPARAERT